MAGPGAYDPNAFDPEAFDPEAFDLGDEVSADPEGSYDRAAHDTESFSEDAYDFAGSGGGSSGFTAASVLVRAYRACFFGNVFRAIGAQFAITSPLQFSPNGMVLVGSPPSDWLPLLTSFSRSIDVSSIRAPGRDETRVPAGGRSVAISSETGNPY